MPRHYKRPDDARKYGYSRVNMENAIKDIRENGTSIKKAAFLHNINRTTLMNHLKEFKCGLVGRPTILTPAEEGMIVHALKKLGEWGFGIDRSAVQLIVMDYLKDAGRQHMFNDGKPGIDWMIGFENRWKHELTRRIAQPFPANRAYACNTAVVDDFFVKLTSVIERLDLSSKPQNIFNVDETGFQTDIGSQKMFCKRGAKNPHKIVASSTKTMYTVQVCCSAIGDFLPMYIVFKGKHLYSTWCNGGPDNVLYNCSSSGWMESEQFVEWFNKVFIAGTQHLQGNKLLVFDGHASHISAKVVEMAQKNSVELLCLPAHTSNILQPLDVGVFKAVKCAWRKCLRDYYDATRYCNVDKKSFPGLLKRLVDTGAFSRTNAINAFEACGIYPLNRLKISDDKLATSVPLTHISSQTDAHNTSQIDESALNSSTSAATPITPTNLLPVVSPRKRIETAILSHLKQITPTDSKEKPVRLKRRTLAECLTSAEVIERLRQEDQQRQTKKSKPSKSNLRSKLADKVAASTVQPTFTDEQSTSTLAKSTQSKSNKDAKKVKRTEKQSKDRRPVLKQEAQSKLSVRKPTWFNQKKQPPLPALDDVEPDDVEPNTVSDVPLTSSG